MSLQIFELLGQLEIGPNTFYVMASRMNNGEFSFELTEINKIKYPNTYFKIDHKHWTKFQCLTARTNFSTRCQFHQQFMSVLFCTKVLFLPKRN